MGQGNKADLYRSILEYPYWLHRMPLGDGRFTPGFKRSNWDDLFLPGDLSGRSFLEVGANDGMYCFEAERRGAEAVLATDIWDEPAADEDWWEAVHSDRGSFDLVREYLESDVSSRTIAASDINPDTVGRFDIVLCSDVLLHVKDFYGAIENLVSVANEMVIVKVPITHELDGTPGLEFTKLTPNRSNWWLPNRSGMEQMLEAAGAVPSQSRFFPGDDGRTTSNEVDDVRSAVVAESGATLHESPALSETGKSIPAETRVKVLAEFDGAHRIHVPTGPKTFGGDDDPEWVVSGATQGWVSAEAVEVEATAPPLKRAQELARSGQFQRLVTSGFSFLRQRLERSPPDRSFAVIRAEP